MPLSWTAIKFRSDCGHNPTTIRSDFGRCWWCRARMRRKCGGKSLCLLEWITVHFFFLYIYVDRTERGRNGRRDLRHAWARTGESHRVSILYIYNSCVTARMHSIFPIAYRSRAPRARHHRWRSNSNRDPTRGTMAIIPL